MLLAFHWRKPPNGSAQPEGQFVAALGHLNPEARFTPVAIWALGGQEKSASCPGMRGPSQLIGGSAGKVVAKLLAEGLIEEIQSRGALPVWRRDGDNARTLRITRRGRQVIRVDDEAAAADELPKKPPARSSKSRQSAQASGAPIMRAGSKQANVIALLLRPQGTTIAAIMTSHRRSSRVRSTLDGRCRATV
jgi:hypothetical protein